MPDAVRIRHRAVVAAHRVRDVLLDDGRLASDAARLTDVDLLGEAVGRVADDVAAQAQPGQAGFRLEPVQEAEAELPGGRLVARGVVPDHVAAEVVVLRPVDERDVARVGAGGEVAAGGDAAKQPEVAVELGIRERSGPISAGSPGGFGCSVRATGRLVRGPAPEAEGPTVALRTRDRVVLALEVVDGEAGGDGLEVVRLRDGRGVRLAGLLARLEAGHVLGAGQRQQVAVLGGVDHHRRVDTRSPAVTALMRWPSTSAADRSCSSSTSSRPLERWAASIASSTACATRGSCASALTRAAPGLRPGRARAAARQRVVRAVVGPDAVAQRAVAGRAAEPLDPRVLVGRHRLARELPPDPPRRSGEHDGRPAVGGGERSGHGTEPGAGDQHVGFAFTSGGSCGVGRSPPSMRLDAVAVGVGDERDQRQVITVARPYGGFSG